MINCIIVCSVVIIKFLIICKFFLYEMIIGMIKSNVVNLSVVLFMLI